MATLLFGTVGNWVRFAQQTHLSEKLRRGRNILNTPFHLNPNTCKFLIYLLTFFTKSLFVMTQFCIVKHIAMDTIIVSFSQPVTISSPIGYIIGVLIALSILCYLIYSLIKPEKF